MDRLDYDLDSMTHSGLIDRLQSECEGVGESTIPFHLSQHNIVYLISSTVALTIAIRGMGTIGVCEDSRGLWRQ